MPITDSIEGFSNTACINILKSFKSEETSTFQFLLTSGRIDNYNYEINESLKGNKSYWSKPISFEKYNNLNNVIYVISDKWADIWICKDTNDIPRKHWKDKFSINGIIEIILVGKLYFDINTMSRVFGYDGFGKQGKFQIVKKYTHYKIIQNLLYYLINNSDMLEK